MADNHAVLEGDGTTNSTFASKDIVGVKHLRIILTDDTGATIATLPISAASLPLPTGAATASNQSAGNTALSAIQTAVELIDNAIAGTEMQVDIVGALPAGANTIGTVNLSTTDNTVLDNIEAGIDELKVLVGAVSASPAENTVQERLLAIETAVVNATVSDTTALEPQEYETVAASQIDQVLGATGATGDYLHQVLIVPATTAPGAVSIKDGAGAAITIFTGGTDSVGSLVPFHVAWGAKSTAGAWSITTGANVSAVGIGTFT